MKLVLLPGLDGTGELFSGFLRALDDVECQIISYPKDREMSYAEHERHVRERLPSGESFALLGESFSGPVAISIAAATPAGLRGLILCCSFAVNPIRALGSMSRLVARFPAMRIPPALFGPLLYGGFGTPGLKALHARAMSQVHPAVLRARVAAVLGVDCRDKLRPVGVPILYLLAKRDRLIPRSALREIMRIRADVHVSEFDSPHFLLQTRALEAANQVRLFLDSL
jgi:pimeloyl-[acyl-carrier protein] methyl ester esterase